MLGALPDFALALRFRDVALRNRIFVQLIRSKDSTIAIDPPECFSLRCDS
jgi:hypothetical protein